MSLRILIKAKLILILTGLIGLVMADNLNVNNEGLIESNYDEVIDNFDHMNLKPELLRGIYSYGLVSFVFIFWDFG